MAKIFISYRESDAKVWAIVLHEQLSRRFGADNIFLDREGLRAGQWNEQLETALADCRALLLVIGNSWISARDKTGTLRLHLDDDVHRAEIRTALQNKHTTVIPILVDRASMPAAEELPVDLRQLVLCQAYRLSDQQAVREVEMDALAEDVATATRLSVIAKEAGSQPQELIRIFAMALVTSVLMSIGVGIANLVTGGAMLTFTEHAFITVTLAVCFMAASVSWRRWRDRNKGQRQKLQTPRPER